MIQSYNLNKFYYLVLAIATLEASTTISYTATVPQHTAHADSWLHKQKIKWQTWKTNRKLSEKALTKKSDDSIRFMPHQYLFNRTLFKDIQNNPITKNTIKFLNAITIQSQQNIPGVLILYAGAPIVHLHTEPKNQLITIRPTGTKRTHKIFSLHGQKEYLNVITTAQQLIDTITKKNSMMYSSKILQKNAIAYHEALKKLIEIFVNNNVLSTAMKDAINTDAIVTLAFFIEQNLQLFNNIHQEIIKVNKTLDS